MNKYSPKEPEANISILSSFRLDGKTALVTGSGRGIGRIASIALSEAGANVILTDIDLKSVNNLSKELTKLGRNANAFKLDVTNPNDVTKKVKIFEDKFKSIDILVNNAGTSIRQPMEKMSLKTYEKIIKTNQTSVFLCSQAVGKLMLKKKSGTIINISSIQGLTGGGPTPNFPYHASKGAIVNMTRSLANEWGPKGIRVNAIGPTYTKTQLVSPLMKDKKLLNFIISRTPLRRLAEVEEIAGAIIFLASPASSMITGHTLMVDGGWTAI